MEFGSETILESFDSYETSISAPDMIVSPIYKSTEGGDAAVSGFSTNRDGEIMGRPWGALCAQYLEIRNINQEEFKRDTTVVITVSNHRMAAGLEAIELELVSVEVPAKMVILQIALGPV
ncbi:hypothetical protein L3X38_025865 [Prunus dulcis]|uniref:Uncharacterized protein n=1 Tax=Prunus dulcis TaxID=3755 RepID=A0AAD4W522_PRUDU|nr:hypothetical protein L3X38_025865 [Prunus dulcis]